ncbi:MAG TPA: PEGA domain-containing protein [Haliangium sp.]|nr:PEGA domain-containing protein [Haliangium sp.]
MSLLISGLVSGIVLGALASEAHAQAKPPCPPRARSARYTVRIESMPPQAAIVLDREGCILGYTPWEGKLDRGTVAFTLEKDGFEPAKRSFDIRRTRRLQTVPAVALIVIPDPPKVEITASADQNVFNAQVWVDGQQQGEVPVILTVGEGRHLIEIRKDGFLPFSQWVEVKRDERVTVNPVLKAVQVEKKGGILVEADVAGAEVYVDGQRHADLTPTLISGLVEGTHMIEVRKDPALPWKQPVTVIADQTVKVKGELAATMKPPGGTVRVISNAVGARVFLDGFDMGPAPLDLKDVQPGEHVVEVKAEGYLPREDRVTVNAGTANVLKLDLQPQPQAAARETGKLKVVSPVPEAAIFIDGERIGTAPQEKDLPPGEHFVVVTKPGYKKFEEKVELDVGQTMTVSAELAAVGALRVLSTPPGADVLVDGQVIGQTPLNQDDIDVGEHVVTVRQSQFYDYEQNINIEGGQRTIVSAKLEMIDTGPTADELIREQRSLSSFSARTLPQGRSTIDIAAGYPHYIEGQFTVGAARVKDFGFDAGVVFRTFLSRTELGIKARLTFFEQEPFSFGVFGLVGGGSNFIDDSGRNTLFFQGGALGSLTAFNVMTVTGRAYFDFWSDRHCPEMETADELDICRDTAKFASNMDRLDGLGFETQTELLEREGGARIMTSLIVEVALWQRWSAWGLFEGAPFQAERAAFSNIFNPLMPTAGDIGTYVRFGATYKF